MFTHPLLKDLESLLVLDEYSSKVLTQNSTLTWTCEFNHLYKRRLGHQARFSGKIRCAVCANKQVQTGVNDLLTLCPKIQFYLIESEVSRLLSTPLNSNLKKEFRCPRGHLFSKTIQRVSQKLLAGKEPCSICNGKVFKSGVNDFEKSDPFLASFWDAAKNKKKR